MNDIIPLPVEMESRPGAFKVTPETRLVCDPDNRWNAEFLRGLLAPATGFPLPIETEFSTEARKGIHLHLTAHTEKTRGGGYLLEVEEERVTITSPTTAGVFHGIQSLRQMLPVEVEERGFVSGIAWEMPCGRVHDLPRFTWRGFMLDEGRHFHGKETVLKTLDLMALQKLNVFHWHLTEDQGWRVEIKKSPRLTEVGAWRPGTKQGFRSKGHDGVAHGGFYTQEDIREIVAYAAQRNILVVPEIEMPGHSLAALAAYPEFSCTGGPFEVATGSGIFPDIYCAGKERTFTFLQEVLEEVLDLFPGGYIHIGGDEAPKSRWKSCPDCQRRIEEEGLEDEHALQAYLTNRTANWLDERGRRLVGWNQILAPGLAGSAVVQFWLGGKKELVKAIRAGRETVMSTYLDTYLDHSYSLMPLHRAYHYEPVPEGLDDTEAERVLGLEFPLWTEWVPNRARLDYQTYPRLTAMAETGWTPREMKDYRSFRRRLVPFLERLRRLGVQPAPLKEAEAPFYKRPFGIFTIAQAQHGTAGGG